MYLWSACVCSFQFKQYRHVYAHSSLNSAAGWILNKNIQWKPPHRWNRENPSEKHVYTFFKNVKWCTSIVHPYIYLVEKVWNQTHLEKKLYENNKIQEDKNHVNLSCSENASRICYFHMNFTILSLVPNFCLNEHILIHYGRGLFHNFFDTSNYVL
jgi:hypothetical protein